MALGESVCRASKGRSSKARAGIVERITLTRRHLVRRQQLGRFSFAKGEGAVCLYRRLGTGGTSIAVRTPIADFCTSKGAP
jgi:hypothetical protein